MNSNSPAPNHKRGSLQEKKNTKKKESRNRFWGEQDYPESKTILYIYGKVRLIIFSALFTTRAQY
jgi:hypothetical protein